MYKKIYSIFIFYLDKFMSFNIKYETYNYLYTLMELHQIIQKYVISKD